MTIFLADASVPLDNNLSEREMKRKRRFLAALPGWL
jgi:hypothetical protein